MNLPTGVRENLGFLLAETATQVNSLRVLVRSASRPVAQSILDHRGYTYSLKMRIHDDCMAALRRTPKRAPDVHSLRAAESIGSSLERLCELCYECVRLIGDLDDTKTIAKRSSAKLLDDVAKGVALLATALDDEDTRHALELSQIERGLNDDYARAFKRHLKRLNEGKPAQDVVVSLFVAQRIKEMGDALLDIGESLLSARMGQPMQVDRYLSLDSAMSTLGVRDGAVERLAETRSGSNISGIAAGAGKNLGYRAVFKDGTRDKLEEERERVESWHDIYPGLAPQIYAYRKRGKQASMLIEHLPGLTLEQIVTHGKDALLRASMRKLTRTVGRVWDETRRRKSVHAKHIEQLRKRLPTVLQVHPEFETGATRIGGRQLVSLEGLLTRAQALENTLPPPFSVFIHGDFNLDNILYDEDTRTIRFIDLHRSRHFDYVQDVAVFMVSNYRLQVLDRRTRARLHYLAMEFYRFAASFARNHGDWSFELRLALGLARSFISSARFVLDRALARDLYLRGIYLLRSVSGETAKSARHFKLPIEALFR